MFGLFGSSFQADRDIPSLAGKVYIVTGGNVGLGRETVLQLSKHNPARIYLGARSEAKAKDAIAAIQKQVPDAKVTFLQMDLTSFASVKAAAEDFNKKESRLDVLVNNAGIMACPEATTKEGYEIQLGTNHMGHALLTSLLLPKLKSTASQPESDVRIVNLSSYGHVFAPREGIVFDTLKTGQPALGPWGRYGQSKLANALFTTELTRRYPDITSVTIHPGSVNTELTRGPADSYPLIKPLLALTPWLLTSLSQGTLNQLWAATSDKGDVVKGEFYNPVAKPGGARKHAKDLKLAESLWEWTEKEMVEQGYGKFP
ncbi:MAG: hypothetical protein M1831_005950 [Alyxoria varia]|nr:MAG: hypothetical protein M1831_005950 [Alyxoria varia]